MHAKSPNPPITQSSNLPAFPQPSPALTKHFPAFTHLSHFSGWQVVPLKSAVSSQQSAVSGQRSAVSGQRSAVSGWRLAVGNLAHWNSGTLEQWNNGTI